MIYVFVKQITTTLFGNIYRRNVYVLQRCSKALTIQNKHNKKCINFIHVSVNTCK